MNWESGRKGLMNSPVLHSHIEVATPPQLLKGMPGIWSGEQLLGAAAVNIFPMITFLVIEENLNSILLILKVTLMVHFKNLMENFKNYFQACHPNSRGSILKIK